MNHFEKSTTARQIRLERRLPAYWRVTFDLPPPATGQMTTGTVSHAEGQNAAIEYRWAEGRYGPERSPVFANASSTHSIMTV